MTHELSTPEGVVEALYAVLSGPTDEERDWGAFRSLFLPAARLTVAFTAAPGDVQVKEHDLELFIHDADAYYRRDGFWEREIRASVQRYGGIAHVLSTYESRSGSPDSPPSARGVNSVQLIRRDGRWWIHAIVWDIEQPHNPIPAHLLPGS